MFTNLAIYRGPLIVAMLDFQRITNKNAEFMEVSGGQPTAWWCNFTFTVMKNDGVRQWFSDDIPYIMEK